MRTILYLLMLPLATIFFGGLTIVSRLLGIKRRPGNVYDWAQRYWARSLLAASGVTASVEGAERITPGVPEVLAANHASFFDILALMAWMPVDPKFIAKIELFRIPVFGQAMTAIGMVALDRHNLKEAFGAYQVAAKRITEEKLHVLVYPEGTRSRTGEMLPFKKGPFVLAIAAGVPVVPIFVHGAFGIQPKGSVVVHPRPLRIIVGEPIATAGLTYDDRDALAQRVRAAMEALRPIPDAASR